jgi:glycosyltransferase involved in cell wall biosynthesis
VTRPADATRAVLPRITIITPCLNGAPHIGEALASLSRQHYPDLEHLLMDAGSTDGTLDVAARFPATTVVSEPDHGSHEAMTKGVWRASGEIIGFLNSDDFYADGTLAEVGKLFRDDPALDMVVGGSVVFRDEKNGARTTIVAREHTNAGGLWPPELTFGAPGLNGRFVRRRVFERVGGFDNDYYYGGDRKFLISVALAGLKSRPLGRTAIFYRSHDRSFTFNESRRNAAVFALENLRMAREFLARAHLTGEWRQILLSWHAFEILRLLLRGPGRLGVVTLISAIAQAARFDPLWPGHVRAAFRYRADMVASERRSPVGFAVPH